MELNERVAQAEARLLVNTEEIGLLRQRSHDLAEGIGILSAQLGALTSQVGAVTTNMGLVAKQAAVEALAEWEHRHAAEISTLRSDRADQGTLADKLVKLALVLAGGLVATIPFLATGHYPGG